MESESSNQQTRYNIRGFKYSPKTGLIYRVRDNYQHSQHIGPCSRTITHSGYLETQCNGKKIRQHRLAALLMGYNLTRHDIVDHVNGDKTDNRWSNLRITTQRINTQNQTIHRNGKPACVRPVGNRWRVDVTINGIRQYLGTYATQKEAVMERDKAYGKRN